MMPKPADVSTGNVTAQEQQSDHGGEIKGGNGETKSDAPALKPDMVPGFPHVRLSRLRAGAGCCWLPPSVLMSARE